MGLTLNYHFTQACNYKCKFCFAKDLGCDKAQSLESQRESLIEALKCKEISRVTFVGGEPTLSKNLVPLIKVAKEYNKDTMVITNGSLLDDKLINSLKGITDCVKVSIDSFINETNVKIGRGSGINYTRLLEKLLKDFEVRVNTVVCKHNYQEIFPNILSEVRKWKLFEVFIVGNAGQPLDASDLRIDNKRFMEFVNNHTNLNPVFNMSEEFQGAYLMMNPDGRLFNDHKGFLEYSNRVTEVGMENALVESGFNLEAYKTRYEREEV